MLTCVWKILSGKYYQENKERLSKSSWKIKRSFQRRKKDQQYGRECYQKSFKRWKRKACSVYKKIL